MAAPTAFEVLWPHFKQLEARAKNLRAIFADEGNAEGAARQKYEAWVNGYTCKILDALDSGNPKQAEALLRARLEPKKKEAKNAAG